MKTQIERRILSSLPVRLEKRAADGKPLISGYASVFYDGTPGTEYQLWDNLYERILPGAFDRAIREDDVRCLFNHDPSMVLGRTASGTCRLSVDAKGLMYETEPGDTCCGQDVQEHLRRGDVSGSSFSFQVTEQRWLEQGEGENYREIREVVAVRLLDVGPVTFPAYEATTAGIRSADGAEVRSLIESARPQRPAVDVPNALNLCRLTLAEQE